jgi:multicomponent Na+:H+ antiporter subunit G
VIALLIDVLLAVAVLSVWLGCVGFMRLPAPMDRLHCVAFVNVTVGLTLTVAAFVADGLSTRSIKVLAITVLSLLAGAASSHVVGRMLLQRSRT